MPSAADIHGKVKISIWRMGLCLRKWLIDDA
jgi:hypothetical protein